MVWHIFKKDWKLLWPLAIAVVALQAIDELLTVKLGLFPQHDMSLMQLSEMAAFLLVLGRIILVTIAVFQDPVPGMKQDWLTRPIRRWDLLGAKLLFAAIFVLAPFLAANLCAGWAFGFGLWATLGPAIVAAVLLGIVFVVPMVAIASFLRSLTQGIVASVIVMAGFVVASALLGITMRGRALGTFTGAVPGSGLHWITEALRLIVVLAAAAAILALQYGKRKTLVSRWLVAPAIILAILVELVPWRPAFALEQKLSLSTTAARNISLEFDSTARPTATRDQGDRRNVSQAVIGIPLRVSGVPADDVLVADRAQVRLTGPAGASRELGGSTVVWQGSESRPQSTHLYFDQPVQDYRAVADQEVTLHVDYSLTLFRLQSSYAIPAVDGEERMPGIGWCESETGPFNAMVTVSCMNPVREPSCSVTFLENAATGERNSPEERCRGDYSPAIFMHDAFARRQWSFATYDPSGHTHYLVDPSKVANARVVFRIYIPVEHFTRQVAIPGVKLADWTSLR